MASSEARAPPAAPPQSAAPPWQDLLGAASPGGGGAAGFVIKNTFIDEAQSPVAQAALRRSKSESSLSSYSGAERPGSIASGQELRFFLPDFSSRSGSSQQGDDDDARPRGGEKLPPKWNAAVALAAAEKGAWPSQEAPPDGQYQSYSFWAPVAPPGLGSTTAGAPAAGVPLACAGLPNTVQQDGCGGACPNRPGGDPSTWNRAPVPQHLPPGTAADYVDMVHRETDVPIADLVALDQQGVLRLIPRDETGALTSVGSLKHMENGCSPCLFWFKGTCAKGLRCTYCHIKHKGQKNKRIRPSKATRQRLREQQGSEAPGDSGDEDEAYGGAPPAGGGFDPAMYNAGFGSNGQFPGGSASQQTPGGFAGQAQQPYMGAPVPAQSSPPQSYMGAPALCATPMDAPPMGAPGFLAQGGITPGANASQQQQQQQQRSSLVRLSL